MLHYTRLKRLARDKLKLPLTQRLGIVAGTFGLLAVNCKTYLKGRLGKIRLGWFRLGKVSLGYIRLG